MDAIIYTTNTGSTERYAKLLSHETGLPAYSLTEAKKKVLAGAEIIYLGWMMAGSVKGYDMLDMIQHGGSRVKFEHLSAVLDWYSGQNRNRGNEA